jgi:methionyl-tRNA synthetase
MSDRRFYVTTPIFYVNDRPHIGTGYTMIATDVLARFHRAAGYDTRYLTGLDEHGQKIAQAAASQGLEPQAFVDKMSRPFVDAWNILGTSHEDLIRTTEPRHQRGVQELWKTVAERGDVYKGEYDGLYCVGCEAYYTEKDLQEGGVCPQGHGKVKKIRMPSYFFKLSKYTDPLLRFYEEHPDFVRPASRMNEVVSFVREGLRDLSISRTNFSWGIPVPGDSKHVMYVWFDALSNYITALGWPEDPRGLHERYWSEAHHVIGKDILRFHAIYWPAMLLAAGLQPPRCVFAHGWLTINGRKMSKTLRNTVDPLALKWELGNDPVRYYLMRDTVFGLDGDFSHDALIERINSDLANDLGNLVNRSANLLHKLAGGRVPERREGGEKEAAVREKASSVAREAADHFHAFEMSRAIESIWTLCAETNRFIQDSQPWTMKSDADAPRRDACLYTMAEAIRQLGHMITPVMPEKGRQILTQLGLEAPDMGTEPAWPSDWGEIEPGTALPPASPIFPRIDKKSIPGIRTRLGVDSAMAEGEEKKQPAKKEPAGDGLIPIDHFGTVDLRVGIVLEAEPVPKTDKLLKISVDLGEDAPRTLVAGIAKAYAPGDLVGKRIIVVANLKPAKLRGITSRGMLLAATYDGLPRVLTVDGEAPPGTKIS